MDKCGALAAVPNAILSFWHGTPQKTNTDMLDKCCKVIIFIEKRKKSKICLENLTKVGIDIMMLYGAH